MTQFIALVLSFLGLAIPLLIFYFLTKRSERRRKAAEANGRNTIKK